MYRYGRGFSLLAFALLLGACAGAGAGAGRSLSAPVSRDVIVMGEHLDRHADAYQVIEALNPSWLRPRGRDSIRNPSQVRVYLDGMSLGGVSQLRSLDTGGIAEIRYFDAVSATQRWGTGHGAGVISITMRR